MRHFLGVFLGLSIAGASLLCAEPFEGTIRFQVTDLKGRVHTMDYQIKGRKIRVDMTSSQAGAMSVIVDSDSEGSIMLMEQKKLYMNNDLSTRAQSRPEESSLERTEHSDVILGYSCQEYIASSARGKTELWVTKGLGNFHNFESGPMSRAAAPSWEKKLSDQGLFPLKIVESNVSLQAIYIDKKSLPDSLFEIPAGYSKIDLNAMTGAAAPH